MSMKLASCQWRLALVILLAATGPVVAQELHTSRRLPVVEASPAPQPTESLLESLENAAEVSALDAADMTIESRLEAIEKKLAAPPKTPAPTLPSVKISGVFQADAGWFDQDTNSYATFGRIQDGADFRRARLGASGNVTPQMSYFFQMDFGAIGRPTFTDVWLAVNEVPFFGNIKVGQWKQPFSLEVVSSFRNTTFMERSLLFQSLTPFRHIGAGFYDWSEDLNWTWAASAFRSGQDQYGGSLSTDGGYGVASRITHLLFWDDDTDGRSYLHVGGAYYGNHPANDRARFRSIPEFFVGEEVGDSPIGTSGQAVPGPLNGTPFFVDTQSLDSRAVNTFGTELLWVAGPLSLQGEAMAALVDRPGNLGTAFLPGAYLQAGYFLTGEHRPYDRKAGAIDRVKPFEDFFWVRTCDGTIERGMGAWEVAGRISYIDLNDEGVRGGQMTDLTLGVNWYLNPYCKLVGNYIHSFLDNPTHGDSETSIFAVRAQLDF